MNPYHGVPLDVRMGIAQEFQRLYYQQWQDVLARIEEMEAPSYTGDVSLFGESAARNFETMTSEEKRDHGRVTAMSVAVAHTIVYTLDKMGFLASDG